MLLAISLNFFSIHIPLLTILRSFGLHRLSMAVRWKRYGSASRCIAGRFAQLPTLFHSDSHLQ